MTLSEVDLVVIYLTLNRSCYDLRHAGVPHKATDRKASTWQKVKAELDARKINPNDWTKAVEIPTTTKLESII